MHRAHWKLLLLALVVALGFVLVRWGPLGGAVHPREVAAALRGLGAAPWAPAAFVLLYAVGTAVGAPGSALTLAGGAVFGLAWGSLWNWLGATAGACLAFGLARGLGREGVQRWLRGRAAALDARMGAHGFRTVLTLRLIPLVPFNALNFAAGLTRIRFLDYALATAVGIVPGTLIYTYFADALLRGSAEAQAAARWNAAVAAALLLAFTWATDRLRRRMERARAGAAPESGGEGGARLRRDGDGGAAPGAPGR